MFLHSWEETVGSLLVSQWWWQKAEIPRNSIEWAIKPNHWVQWSHAFHGTLQHTDHTAKSITFLNQFLILTYWIGGSPASWMRSQAQLIFSRCVQQHLSASAYPHRKPSRKQDIHHIFTGTNWNSASDRASRYEQSISSKRREQSWLKCYCLSLSS